MVSARHKVVTGLAFLSLLVLISLRVSSHCEIPCGIYDDEMRINMIAENITTVEKSMKQIIELSGQDKKNMNQIVRWVQNKENHADEISHIVTQYFMTQRLKPVEADHSEAYMGYVEKLTLLHQMLVYSMKAKQTTDLANVEELRSLLTSFKAAYLN